MLREATTLQVDVKALNWRTLARCHQAPVEMVPGGEEDQGTREELAAAKQVCLVCPVKQQCLDWAEGARRAPIGVWGGLSETERERIRVSRSARNRRGEKVPVRQVQPCALCGLDCVPRFLENPKCDSCLPDEEIPARLDDFRDEIVAMIELRMSYGEIAKALNLREQAVSRACWRWGTRSKRWGPKYDEDELKPCGTPAAILRHKRAGEIPTTCACAFTSVRHGSDYGPVRRRKA